jgi:nitroreductase
MGLFLLVPPGHWSVFDGGQCAAYLQLAAWERGIGSCLGGFVDAERARELLGWPSDLELLISISFGRPPKEVVERPPRTGGRRPLDEIVHREKW